MTYRLSKRSIDNLANVSYDLSAIVQSAINYTDIDFGVTEGFRSMARQKELLRQGATKTLNSMHLQGRAVDLMAYIDGKAYWSLDAYDNIADAMRRAASGLCTPLRWGGAWHIADIRTYPASMEQANIDYVDLRRSQGRRPFIDAVHFEI